MVIQSINGIYMHCAWGTSANGADFSLVEFADATYRGIYYDRSPAESMDPISYKWILIDSIDGDATEDDAIEAENAAALANAQAEQANSQTIVNNDNLQASQYSTDDKVGNPNELVGTNQGTNGWTASAGLTISSVTDTIYNPTDDPVNYLHVVCDSAGSNYICFDATALRGKLSELTDDNAFTFSADLRMSTVFALSVAVQNVDGTDQQIDFGTIDTELIPVPEETADGLWTFNKLTADMVGGVAESSQVLYIDLSNMSPGDTLDVANLKVEGGALATPWRASLDEVAQIANQAYQVAGNTQQHFWFTSTGADTGAHITEKTQDDFLQDPANGGGNLLARSNGIAIRDGMTELATLQQSGMDVNTDDGLGNTVNIAHLGFGPGTDSGGGTSDAPYYSLGKRTGAVGNYSVAEGHSTTASGYVSHSEGYSTTASAYGAHAEGKNTEASGDYSHAEGEDTEASGVNSHAEGFNTTASLDDAHAEGIATTASAVASHAEGYATTASGDDAHAEGIGTTASANHAHAQNYYTTASSNNQTALGKYNIEDNADTYAVIVGNGTSDGARSNALTIDWSGNVVASGDITDGANNVLANKLDASVLADYVIERGTSGNWHYIKWHSGRVELEGYYTFASLSFSASGNMYRSVSNAFTIPSGIFTTAPTEGQAWIQGSNTVYPSATIGGLTTTGGNCQIWKSTSGNATNVSVHMRIVYR